jgi:hypothetical protein
MSPRRESNAETTDSPVARWPFELRSEEMAPTRDQAWPAYVRMEHKTMHGAWDLNLSHERRARTLSQALTVIRELMPVSQGRLGFKLSRWVQPPRDSQAQLGLVMQLAQSTGDWQLRLNQNLTLLTVGERSVLEEEGGEWSPSGRASLGVSYVGSAAPRADATLHLDTVHGRAWAEVEHQVHLGEHTRADVGYTIRQGGLNPRLHLHWHQLQLGVGRSLNRGMQLNLRVSGDQWAAEWQGEYHTGARQRIRASYTQPTVSGGLLMGAFQGTASQPEGSILWQGETAWSGEPLGWGPDWQASVQLRVRHGRVASTNASVAYVTAGGSLRRSLDEKNALAVGGMWPTMQMGEKVQQTRCTWVAWERQLGEWDGRQLWGSLELRRSDEGLSPGIHFALR